MSRVQIGLAWCRSQLSWSNSRQSWEERLSGLALLLLGVGLWFLGDSLSLLQQVFLWALLFLAVAFLLRRGWLKLFGPVLFYDMIRLARRSRYFYLRVAYAGLLIFFLFTTWLGMRGEVETGPQAALLAESYFGQFMLIQLIAVSVLTPAYVAGAIADEKERKTLEFMLATDLRNREIIFSKLGSRLANLTLFILTGLPILSILQFLGGVDPPLMLAGFVATLMTMIGVAGFSILCSVQFKKPRDAIAIAYLGALTYLAVGLVGFAFQQMSYSFFSWPLWWGDNPPTMGEVMNLFNSGNLVVAIFKVMKAIFTTGLGSALGPVLRDYTIFHSLLGLTCTTWAVLRLRAIALEQFYGTPRQTLFKHRQRPEVGDVPMLWKEIHIEGNVRFNWAARIFIVVLFLLTVGSGLWGIGYAILDGTALNNPRDFAMGINMWVRFAGTVVALLMLLGVAVRASTAISSERDKDTLDALLTTPLDSDTILWAKFLGCLLSMRRGFIWLGLIWGVGFITGAVHILALPLMLLAWVIYASTFTLLGLWFSVVSLSSMRATIWTVMTTAAIFVGQWLPWACCIPLAIWGGFSDNVFEGAAKFQTGMTPPAVLWILPLNGWEFEHGHEFAQIVLCCMLGLFLYTVGNLGFWFLLLSPRFRRLTHREDYLFPRAEAAQEMLHWGERQIKNEGGDE